MFCILEKPGNTGKYIRNWLRHKMEYSFSIWEIFNGLQFQKFSFQLSASMLNIFAIIVIF